MQITIYAKKRQSKDGRNFYTYLTTLPKKDGTEETIGVKFTDEAGAPRPENCPMNLVIDRSNANVGKRNYTNEDGEICVSKTMWVKKWMQGDPYVDTSLDEYDI